MLPYPSNNDIKIKPAVPHYKLNPTKDKNSRYSIYSVIDNNNYKSLEIKLIKGISTNATYKGYYHKTTKNETLYAIAKKYYNSEEYYWILAKANGLRNDGLTTIPKNTVIIVPNMSELQNINGGYYSLSTDLLYYR